MARRRRVRCGPRGVDGMLFACAERDASGIACAGGGVGRDRACRRGGVPSGRVAGGDAGAVWSRRSSGSRCPFGSIGPLRWFGRVGGVEGVGVAGRVGSAGSEGDSGCAGCIRRAKIGCVRCAGHVGCAEIRRIGRVGNAGARRARCAGCARGVGHVSPAGRLGSVDGVRVGGGGCRRRRVGRRARA